MRTHVMPGVCSLLLIVGCGGSEDIVRPGELDLGPARDGATIALDAAVDAAVDAGLPVLDAEAADGAPVDGAPVDGGLADGALDAEADAGPPADCPPDMVRVPAGDFRFGPLDDLRYLPAFCIDAREVSAGQYLDCVADGGCDGYEMWTLCIEGDARRPNQCREDALERPANWIDWFRAEQYCRWAGRRLPDEGQWEKAARGADGRTYPWGERIGCADAHVERGEPFDACLGVDGLPDVPVEVDRYADVESPYGAINMVGNVREWVDLRIDREVLPGDDEMGVAKGGDWRASFDQVMNPDRDGTLSVSRSSQGHGVRCALDL